MGAALRPGAESALALVSIHDVMPGALDPIQRLLDHCAAINPGPLTLLVVPGLPWDPAEIERLRSWQDQGHRLAGHGWLHRVERLSGLLHRLHGLLISRRVAEHLALGGSEIDTLIRRCHAWFQGQGLGPPELYVPPAWALGAIATRRLAQLPFGYYEVFYGVLEGASGGLTPIPLLGYEADAPHRIPFLRTWNRINRAMARSRGWLRIAIHPRDLDLALATDLDQDLRRYSRWVDYGALASTFPAKRRGIERRD